MLGALSLTIFIPLRVKRVGKFIEIRHKKISPTHIHFDRIRYRSFRTTNERAKVPRHSFLAKVNRLGLSHSSRKGSPPHLVGSRWSSRTENKIVNINYQLSTYHTSNKTLRDLARIKQGETGDMHELYRLSSSLPLLHLSTGKNSIPIKI